MNPISVAIADDHYAVREFLADFVRASSEFQIVFQANNGQELIDFLKLNPTVDICILDICMPVLDGIDTLKQIRRTWPSIKTLVLSMHLTEFNVNRTLKEGANGIFSKDDASTDLIPALKEIYNGGFYAPDHIPRDIIKSAKRRSLVGTNITEREMSFLKFSCTELSYEQIAERMGIGKRTVDGYRESLFRKLNVTCRTGLILFAIKSGIVNIYKDVEQYS
jgi:DNA-binding NarL/FixJ family response regulator